MRSLPFLKITTSSPFFKNSLYHVFSDKKHTPIPADSAPNFLHNFIIGKKEHDVKL
jgi:hypothetical protein